MPELSPILTLDTSPAPQNMVRVVVKPTEEQLRSFSQAGQYVMASINEQKPKALALANAPSSETFTFLLKENDNKAREALLNLSAASFKMSEAMGKGFPLKEAQNKPLLLAGVGSGIAPLLSVLLHFDDPNSEFSLENATLLYGLTDIDALPEADILARLQKSGLSTTFVFSQKAKDDGLKGYVQEHLSSLSLAQETVTFLCGLRPMEEDLIAALAQNGISKQQVFRNY